MNTTAPTRDAIALLTDETSVLLQLALTGTPGARLEGFEHRIERVHHRPGAESSIRCLVRYRPQLGAPFVEERLVLSTGEAARGGAGVVELGSPEGDRHVFAWRTPGDPVLPAIAASHDADTVAAWLGRDGAQDAIDDEAVDAVDAPALSPSDFEAEVLAYRPLRRAIVRVRVGEATAFVKTVRAATSDAFVRRHRVAEAAGVGPRIVATPMPGTLVLEPVRGVTLARSVAAALAGEGATPDARSFIALLDRLPAEALDLSRRASWTERLDVHARAAADAHPDLADEVARVAADIAEVVAASDPGPVVPTHGDPAVANVMLVDGQATGLVDVDGLGPGRRVDDLACTLAHLAVLPSLSPSRYAGAERIIADWDAVFAGSGVDPVSLRIRTAATLLTLVTAARPAQARARLSLARAWADAAAGRAEHPLRIDHHAAPTGAADRRNS